MDTADLADPVRGAAGHWMLWSLQVLLAMLFLFAGVMKLIMPSEALAEQSTLPVAFLRFIAVCEILGGLGLILPGLIGRARALTPVAAIGLLIIMIGAVSVTFADLGAGPAIFPLLVGVLCAVVAYGRRNWFEPLSRAA